MSPHSRINKTHRGRDPVGRADPSGRAAPSGRASQAQASILGEQEFKSPPRLGDLGG